jgi:hypothetical protein
MTFKELHLCVFCMTIANRRLSGKCGNLNRSGTSPGIIGIWEKIHPPLLHSQIILLLQ